ncbi:MAG: hypothetical protein AMK72_09405 [Planctomycetes bacterium SM23_25]|nr:MAG: hypothetical protein AMK72_09405 [Planctomycetes bacterium SM23_25]
MKKLTTHPRLLAGEEELARLRRAPEMPAMAQAHKDLVRNARRYLRKRKLTWGGKRPDPSGLGTAREMIDRYIALATAFRKTGDQRLRDAALEYIQELDALKAGRLLAQKRMQGFWLSDGEECAGIAIVYDWLYDFLSEAQRATLVDLCRKRLFAGGLKQCRKGGQWWFGKRFSNWNAVCAGGLGMLCLAMYDDCPEARRILPHVEKSLAEFMTPLRQTDGGWPEGLGYWIYGMTYAFGYMLSWERSTGEVHPLMKLPATKKTLNFPFDFFPNGKPAGFGDNDRFFACPFHYLAATRFKLERVKGAIDKHMADAGRGMGGLMGGPSIACVLHPGTASQQIKTERQVAKVRKGLGWGLIADSMPEPRLYLSIRGGSTTHEHAHLDLLSFRVLVGKEWLIENGRNGPYLHPTAFSQHRFKINELNATYKNTLLINGVGPLPGSATDKEQAVRGQGCYGVRMDASSAMAVQDCFCARLALMVDDSALVVIDRVQTPDNSRVEARMHSYHDVAFGRTGAMIRGETESLRVTYASLEPAGLFRATTIPATPTHPSATMMRWSPLSVHTETVLVTLLTPGRPKAAAAIARDGRNFLVTVTIKGVTREIRVRPSLMLV